MVVCMREQAAVYLTLRRWAGLAKQLGDDMNASARVLLVRAKLAVRVLKRRSADTPLTQSALQVGVLAGAMRCCLARHGGRGVFAGGWRAI